MWDNHARFTAIVNACSADLYRYAFWLCRDRDTAQDLVQETFARAWKSVGSLRDDKAAKAWLITTLRREHARTFSRERPQIADADLEAMADTRPGYDTSAEAWQLRRALLNLSREYREPLILQVVYGYSCEEIGSLLDLHVAAVMTRLFRARKYLKSMLTEDEKHHRGAIQ